MKKLFFAVTIIGVVGLALNMIFGWETFTFLRVVRADPGFYLYKFDLFGYTKNLTNSFSTVNELALTLPTREINNDIVNNMILFLDWFIFGLNVMIYPFRIGGYVVLQILALIGINTVEPNSAGGLQWLVTVSQFLRDLQIPLP